MARPASLKESLPGLRGLLAYLWPYIRKQRRTLAGAFAALFAGVIMRALEPWPIKLVFDHVILPTPEAGQAGFAWLRTLQPFQVLGICAGALMLIVLGRAVSNYYERVGFAVVGNRVLTEVRGALFRHVQGLSMAFHNRARGGDILVRVMGDIGMLKEVSVTAMMPMIGNILVLALMTGLMFWLNWKLALVVLATTPLYWLPTAHFGRRIQRVSRKQRQREGKMAAGTAEMIGAMQAVQTLSLEDDFADRVAGEDQKNLKEGVKFRRLLARMTGTVQLMTGFSTAGVLFLGTWLVMQGELTAGSLLVFLSYLKAAFKPLQSFTKYSGRIAKASAAGERVIELFETEPDVVDLPGAITAPPFEGKVRFRNVSFAYDSGHGVLKGVDLQAGAGDWIAITGPSGAGKSTLVGLITRLHDPSEGSVEIDGVDLRQYTLSSLRQQVAFVLQDTLLFATTIRENIALGRKDATDEEIETAARLARAHEFILDQPDGYDTVVGERGVTLSVGQRQRIAVARAALSRAPILILDEPSTGLDERNRGLLLDALEDLARNRTVFMITHEPAEAARANRIIVLENGVVMETGAAPDRANGAPPAGKSEP